VNALYRGDYWNRRRWRGAVAAADNSAHRYHLSMQVSSLVTYTERNALNILAKHRRKIAIN